MSLDLLTFSVRSRFLSIFNPVEDEEIFADGRIISLLRGMPDNMALSALNEYAYAISEVGSNIRNKAGFLTTTLKRYQSGENKNINQNPIMPSQPRLQRNFQPPNFQNQISNKIPMRQTTLAGNDGLTRPIKIKLEQLYGTNVIRRDQMDARCMNALRNLSEDEAFLVLSEISRRRDLVTASDQTAILLSIFQNFSSMQKETMNQRISTDFREQYDQYGFPPLSSQMRQHKHVQSQIENDANVVEQHPYLHDTVPNQGHGSSSGLRYPNSQVPYTQNELPNYNKISQFQAHNSGNSNYEHMSQQRSGVQNAFTDRNISRMGYKVPAENARSRERFNPNVFWNRNDQIPGQATYFGPPPPGTERMSVALQNRIGALYGSGVITPHEVEPRALNMLERLPENVALRAIDEFFKIDKNHVRKLGPFFSGVLRKSGESIGLFSPHATPSLYATNKEFVPNGNNRDGRNDFNRNLKGDRTLTSTNRDFPYHDYHEKYLFDDRKRGREEDYRERLNRREVKYPRFDSGRFVSGQKDSSFKKNEEPLFPYLHKKLSAKAYEGFLELVYEGLLIASEVDDERIGEAAVRLKESDVLGALAEFRNCDFTKVRNKSGYLMGLMKRYRSSDGYFDNNRSKRTERTDVRYIDLADVNYAKEASHLHSNRSRDAEKRKADVKSADRDRHSKSREKETTKKESVSKTEKDKKTDTKIVDAEKKSDSSKNEVKKRDLKNKNVDKSDDNKSKVSERKRDSKSKAEISKKDEKDLLLSSQEESVQDQKNQTLLFTKDTESHNTLIYDSVQTQVVQNEFHDLQLKDNNERLQCSETASAFLDQQLSNKSNVLCTSIESNQQQMDLNLACSHSSDMIVDLDEKELNSSISMPVSSQNIAEVNVESMECTLNTENILIINIPALPFQAVGETIAVSDEKQQIDIIKVEKDNSERFDDAPDNIKQICFEAVETLQRDEETKMYKYRMVDQPLASKELSTENDYQDVFESTEVKSYNDKVKEEDLEDIEMEEITSIIEIETRRIERKNKEICSIEEESRSLNQLQTNCVQICAPAAEVRLHFERNNLDAKSVTDDNSKTDSSLNEACEFSCTNEIKLQNIEESAGNVRSLETETILGAQGNLQQVSLGGSAEEVANIDGNTVTDRHEKNVAFPELLQNSRTEMNAAATLNSIAANSEFSLENSDASSPAKKHSSFESVITSIITEPEAPVNADASPTKLDKNAERKLHSPVKEDIKQQGEEVNA